MNWQGEGERVDEVDWDGKEQEEEAKVFTAQ